MARDRLSICLHYVCLGECKKGREAEHKGYCQKCDKYVPRDKVRSLNIKKKKVEELRKKHL